jgi:asparagine synthase (glutamine-hydrolysing)
MDAAIASMSSRGPDSRHFFSDNLVTFGHCRLSIIDLSHGADQPLSDKSGRYYIIYNGEIFNFRQLRNDLISLGVAFNTQSDTEVVLQLFIKHGKSMVSKLNGFFAFAIYDRLEKKVFIARDRLGVKPLHIYEDENCFLFASEIKALLQFPVEKAIDEASLFQYLQLNYIPAPHTIFKKIKKLLPGHFISIENDQVEIQPYYTLPDTSHYHESKGNFESKKKELVQLLDSAVEMRLISDVPLGGFLSGGIDSSIICGIASKHTDHLKTFSIGFSDDQFFDETAYAEMVAKHFKTDHTVFSLSRSELFDHLYDALDFFDEPFGDSSSLPVYLLSKLTRKEVKVALSGDGADELFGGYLKHSAEFRARNPSLPESLIPLMSPVINKLPSSRNSSFYNRLRQLQRFAAGMSLGEKERYWKWCTISNEAEVMGLLKTFDSKEEVVNRKNELTSFIHPGGNLNQVLRSDVNMVLPNDMLTKVDSMSMANSLEVRNPFLDYRIVEFAFSIPSSYKLNRRQRKIILHEAYRNFLPPQLYHRPKKGFEIPLHSFLVKELRNDIENNFLSESLIAEQGIFNYAAISALKARLYSANPADSAAQIWNLFVFQYWWKKWIAA